MPTSDDYLAAFPYYRGSAVQLPPGAILPEEAAGLAPPPAQPPVPYAPNPYLPSAVESAGGSGGDVGAGASPDALKYLTALASMRGGGGGGGNMARDAIGMGATGAAIGTAVAPGIGTAIGGGIGLLGGVLGDIFGGGPSEQEQVDLERSKLALEELQRYVAGRDATNKWLDDPAVAAATRAPIEERQAGSAQLYPPRGRVG